MSDPNDYDPRMRRRTTIKYLGGAAAAGGGIPVSIGVVDATESGDAEIELQRSIPGSTSIDATVEEHDSPDSDTPLLTDTVTVTEVGVRESLPDLDGLADNNYDFELTLNGGEDTPELESVLFEVPRPRDDFEQIDYTNGTDWQAKPDHVSIEWDEWRLRKYQPLLYRSDQAREDFKGLFGYVASSDEHDTDAMCYWAQFTHQEGLPGVSADSHLGDHEPIYVFVDSTTGDVVEIVYTAYHWFANTVSVIDQQDILTTDWADYPTHADFTVVDPWHHYRFTPSRGGGWVELRNWPQNREKWIRNGFYEPAHVPAIENPWVMRDRDAWWADGTSDKYLAGLWARLGRILGRWGGENTDVNE